MNTDERGNIVLIGMPGCGKSTVGVMLAKRIGYDFVDTDVLIQVRTRRSLQRIVEDEGFVALCRIEEQVLLGLDVRRHVVATGGSAVYGADGMRYLRKNGTIVFLDTPRDVLRVRLHDYETRGIAAPPGTAFEKLFEERRPLYYRYADVRVDCGERIHEQIVEELRERLGRAPGSA